MFKQILLATTALASLVDASRLADVKAPLRARDDNTRSCNAMTNQRRMLRARQQVDPDSEVDLDDSNASTDLDIWDEETTSACRDALAELDSASNPSGTGICYNLPSLNTDTGEFEADLRLFKVSDPSGQFAGIAAEDVQVALSFNGASVQTVTPDRISGGGMIGQIGGNSKRQDDSGIELLSTYMFVGRIDQDRMSADFEMADFEALVMPVLTLSAENTTGETVSTTVSGNEAAFLTGVFSDCRPMSDFAMAEQVAANMTDQMLNGDVAFVLPGVQLMIFPIGLIITSIWLVIGLTAYGIGTYERLSYAESFKKRTAMASNKRPSPI